MVAAMKGAEVRFDFRLTRSRKFVRSDMCDQPAGAEQSDAVAEIESLIKIVGYEQYRRMQAAQQIPEHVLHLGASEGIERTEWLIHEQNPGLGCKGAGKTDTLALAARKLVRITMREDFRIKANRREQLFAAPDALFARPALNFEDNAHVALDREMWEKAGLLDDIADASAQGDQVGVDIWFAMHQHLAIGRLDHTVDGA
jgi:hypothetical protein